jgi:hypothetical protein
MRAEVTLPRFTGPVPAGLTPAALAEPHGNLGRTPPSFLPARAGSRPCARVLRGERACCQPANTREVGVTRSGLPTRHVDKHRLWYILPLVLPHRALLRRGTPAAMAWFQFAGTDAATPTPRECHTFEVVGSKLLMFGGNDGSSRFSDVYSLDTGT